LGFEERRELKSSGVQEFKKAKKKINAECAESAEKRNPRVRRGKFVAVGRKSPP